MLDRDERHLSIRAFTDNRAISFNLGIAVYKQNSLKIQPRRPRELVVSN
jgi:hypothetical protein